MNTNIRFITCGYCGGEGRKIVALSPSRMNVDPEQDCGPCPVCLGECVVEVETEPVTMDDLLEEAA